MEQFIKHFRREAPGIWVCEETANMQLPEGRIQVTPGSRFTLGTSFMNVDLARILEDAYQKGSARR
jgi:hypothetical protein